VVAKLPRGGRKRWAWRDLPLPRAGCGTGCACEGDVASEARRDSIARGCHGRSGNWQEFGRYPLGGLGNVAVPARSTVTTYYEHPRRNAAWLGHGTRLELCFPDGVSVGVALRLETSRTASIPSPSEHRSFSGAAAAALQSVVPSAHPRV
jgi:hypothetical protein